MFYLAPICTKFRLNLNTPTTEILISKKQNSAHTLCLYIEYDFYKSHRLYPQTAFTDGWC
jgi:hypothetical protein